MQAGHKKEADKKTRSAVCCFIEVALLLTVLSALGISLIYYFGTQKHHTDIPHALDQIFGSKQHQDLVNKLNKKTYQHSVVWGVNQTGIFQFLQHYADVRAGKGGLVIVRRVEDNFYETALKFLRYTKSVIEENINLETESQKVEWIFLVKNGQISQQQIQSIRTKRPADRVTIGLVQKKPVKGFKFLKFPPVSLQLVKQVIALDFGVSAKEAQILTNFYGNIPQIIHHLDQISYTHQKHLGQYYQNIKDLGKIELKTLKSLCKDGNVKVQGNKASLEQLGIAIYDNIGYWQKRVNKLNYQLNQGVECVDKIVPPQIQILIDQQKQIQSKQQIQAGLETEQPQKSQLQKKPKQSSKGSSKKQSGVQKQEKKKSSQKVTKKQTKQQKTKQQTKQQKTKQQKTKQQKTKQQTKQQKTKAK